MNIQLFLFTLVFKLSNSLIGLRPPSADPTYRRHQRQITIVNRATKHQHPLQRANHTQANIQKFILQRSSKTFVLKKAEYENLKHILSQKSKSNGTTVLTEVAVNRMCDHYTSVRCSIRFLKSTIKVTSSECHNFEDLLTCLCPYCISNECSIQNSLKVLALDRKCDLSDQNLSSKGSSLCCEDVVLKCTIDAYLSLTETHHTCETISDFTACIADVTSTLSDTDINKIFRLILSLTKTCIFSLNS